MRGQLHWFSFHYFVVRIIPARAGPTPHRWNGSCRWSDHPRSCGANQMSLEGGESVVGSSPLVRGQRVLRGVRSRRPRIIPARAGPTGSPAWLTVTPPDHPRSCGANGSRTPPVMHKHGSSPLVRGQRKINGWFSVLVRIIPARAGPTIMGLSNNDIIADHPRSCGANGGYWRVHMDADGSSPLVRGQRFRKIR